MRRMYTCLISTCFIAPLLCATGCGSGTASSPSLPTPAELGAGEKQSAVDAIEVLLAKDRIPEAEIIARALLLKAPRDPIALELLARVLGIRVLRDNAVAGDQVLDEAARAALLASELSDGDAVRAHAAALLLDRAGLRQEATTRWIAVAALAVEQHDTRFAVSAAIALSTHNQPSQVSQLIALLKAQGASNAVLASTAAQIQLALGEPKLALNAAREAHSLDTESMEYRLLYARVLRLNGASEDAALLLNGLPELTLAMPVVAEELALALCATDRFAQAAAALRRTRVHGTNARLLAEEGLALVRANELAQAARVLDELRTVTHASKDIARLESAITLAAQPR